ncbi:MAG: Release factor glutamine methyltransferase [Bacteroidia bacterium]|nr:Release factor glutamine methyltransferase [Bacteroidia bacterium]
MKVIDNRAVSVYALFRKELENLYPTEEIETFLFFSFSEYFGFSRSDMVLKKEMRLSESELLKFFRVIRKLKLHVPIQYILGNTEFYGLKLKVNEHVLIPRPETEELVDWIIRDVTSSVVEKQSLKILDIGTGSGCIAIALKKNMPEAEVYALDISANALTVAKENAELNTAEIHFLQDDILEFYRRGAETQSNNKDKKNSAPLHLRGEKKFDLIVSNPPYITEAEKEAMSANVLDYEPHTALFVPDNDALLFYRAILDFANEKLAPGGNVYFELNSSYAAAVAGLAADKGFINCIIRKDLSGKERMFRSEKESLKKL